MSKLLLARPLIDARLAELTQEVHHLKSKNVTPFMKVILVGEHAPSLIYTRNKKRFIEDLGAKCEIIHFPESATADQIKVAITDANQDKNVHGLFIQLPLPAHLKNFDPSKLVVLEKDVDGLSPESQMALYEGDTGENCLLPCTPKGIISLMDFNHIDYRNKKIAILGRGMLVGKPLSLLMTNLNATVTLCHSKTANIKQVTKESDIIIAAIGRPKFIDATYIGHNHPTIIDVGINKLEDGTMCGDVDFDNVKSMCGHITPVPGGVGPLTILSLAENLIIACKKQNRI